MFRPRISQVRSLLLPLYRAALLILVIVLLRGHFDQLRIQGDKPIELEEIRTVLPVAARLSIDIGPEAGLFVFDAAGNDIGYAVRTSPQAEDVIGYAGPTDVLIIFGPPDVKPNPLSLTSPPTDSSADKSPLPEPTRKVRDIRIRHSWDTIRHIQWVKDDAYFMQFWRGRDWRNLAGLNLYDEYMEGVSGATLSSMGIARSIQRRLQTREQQTPARWHFARTDVGILIALAIGLFVTYRSGWKRNKFLWAGLKIAAFVYVGFLNGSLIALAVLKGYATQGIAWQIAPGLVSLVLVSFFLPWSTRRQPYCNHICPHGAAQQLLSRYSPWKFSIPPKIAAGLRWLPGLLLGVALLIVMLDLPIDIAHLEPFDGYLFFQADWIPIGLLISSLVISAVVPLAYCKYGCPTGALLEFVRSHGRADHFGRRDWAAAALLGLTALLIWQHEHFRAWLEYPAWM